VSAVYVCVGRAHSSGGAFGSRARTRDREDGSEFGVTEGSVVGGPLFFLTIQYVNTQGNTLCMTCATMFNAHSNIN